MDISLCNEFDMIAKHGNLSEAAIELHTTQSALSRHIAALEKELGAELFDRSKTPMELTPAGEVFLKSSSIIAVEWLRAVERVHEIAMNPVTTVVVGGVFDAPISLALRQARALVGKTRPNLRIRYDKTTFQTSFEMLRNHDYDIAIEPISDLIDIHALKHEHLLYEEAYIVVEASNELASRESFTVDDLRELDFLSLRSNIEHAVRKHLQALCEKNGIAGAVPGGFQLSPNATDYDELFLAGLDGGAVMLPKSIALRYCEPDNPGYVARPLEGEDTPYDFHVFYREDRSQDVTDFLGALLDAAEKE